MGSYDSMTHSHRAKVAQPMPRPRLEAEQACQALGSTTSRTGKRACKKDLKKKISRTCSYLMNRKHSMAVKDEMAGVHRLHSAAAPTVQIALANAVVDSSR